MLIIIVTEIKMKVKINNNKDNVKPKTFKQLKTTISTTIRSKQVVRENLFYEFRKRIKSDKTTEENINSFLLIPSEDSKESFNAKFCFIIEITITGNNFR